MESLFRCLLLLKKVTVRYSPAIITCSLLLIIFLTLKPFNFSFQDGSFVNNNCLTFFQATPTRDKLRNILLFLPFGFGLTGFGHRIKLRMMTILLIVLIASFGLSFLVEILQMFLPQRCSSFSDLLTNTSGGLLGFTCFRYFLTSLSNLKKTTVKCLSPKKLTLTFIGYALLSLIIVKALLNGTNLSNWNPTFPLQLGNEQAGHRPWQGIVSEVSIHSRAISEAEVAGVFSNEDLLPSMNSSLVALYKLQGRKDHYRDMAGHLPDLSWRGSISDTQKGMATLLTSSHWLETKGPANFLTQKLRKTSQFTLNAIVATAEPAQTELASIISLSGSKFLRNFTFGQQGNALVFGLRTPITGIYGKEPILFIPNIFVDTNLHHIIITYDGLEIRFYIDRLQNLYSLKLNPEITIFRYLSLPLSGWWINLKAPNIAFYKILFYGLIFVPLGSLIAFIIAISTQNKIF